MSVLGFVRSVHTSSQAVLYCWLVLVCECVWQCVYIFCICIFMLCDHTRPLCLLWVDVSWWPTVCVCVLEHPDVYLDVCFSTWRFVHVCISVQECEFLYVCTCVHAHVAERPYDKWLPGWLKRTLSLHNEHRRSISHCLWGMPGPSAAKVPVISRISTNVD